MKMKAVPFFETLGSDYAVKQHHVQGERRAQLDRCENLSTSRESLCCFLSLCYVCLCPSTQLTPSASDHNAGCSSVSVPLLILSHVLCVLVVDEKYVVHALEWIDRLFGLRTTALFFFVHSIRYRNPSVNSACRFYSSTDN